MFLTLFFENGEMLFKYLSFSKIFREVTVYRLFLLK